MQQKKNLFQTLILGCLLTIWTLIPSVGLAAELESRWHFASEGQQIIAALELQFPPEYHAYAHQTGDTGKPTTLSPALADGKPLPVWYPAGKQQKDIYDTSAVIQAYDGVTYLFVPLSAEAAGKPLSAVLDLLMCSDKNCLPVRRDVSVTVPEEAAPLAQMPWAAQWQEVQKIGPAVSAAPVVVPLTAAPSTAAPELSSGTSGDLNDKFAAALARRAGGTAAGQEPQVAAGQQSAAEPQVASPQFSFTPRYADDSVEISSLSKALLLGILAGLLLNAMPCVLPVLTFKISGLLLMGGNDKESLKRFREHNIFFAAGVLSLFTALALVLGMADLMWGQLYQSQGVLLVMLLIVFLMGLSMLGVFTLPVIDLKTGSNTKNPRLQSYLTGLVSTFLATPCSGPLLGGVLGWAFTQPLIILMVVFWAVGVGMSLPYIVFCIWPSMARILPRPGQWMHVFERVVGFFLLATALYLLSILPSEKHLHVLSVLLLVSLCAWLWGEYCGIAAPPMRRRVAGIAGLAIMALAVVWVLRPVTPIPNWQPFEPASFSAQLGKKPMMVEFTADWCPNCKFLEATVLTNERLRVWKEKYGMQLIRVDLTSHDPVATRLLEALGSKSIPLTALFPAGDDAASPMVLRDVYGAGTLEKALKQTFAP